MDEPGKRSFVDVWFEEYDDVQCLVQFHGQIPYPANDIRFLKYKNKVA